MIMFYQTTVKSVTAGGVIDVQGKSLSLIGNKFVRAGDLIWTDGNVVFGHTPIRGGGILPDEPSGIPVLGARDLRGYFTSNGKFKRYNIAGDDWIVNDKKIYAHDTDNADIIDAEISADGALYTVEKKITDFEALTDKGNILFYCYASNYYSRYQIRRYYLMVNLPLYNRGIDTILDRYIPWWNLSWEKNCDYVKSKVPLVKEAVYERNPSRFTDGEFIDKGGDAILRDCRLIIKKDGNAVAVLNLSKLVEPAEQAAIDYVNITVPNRSFKEYIKSRANLLNFKIMPDGKWSALLLIEIGAERDFPMPDMNIYDGSFKYLNSLGYASTAAHSLFMFKVNSDGNAEKLAERSEFFPLWLIDNIRYRAVTIDSPVHKYNEDIQQIPPFVVNPTTFPYEDWVNSGWSWIWVDFSGEETGYDRNTFTLFTVYDSRLMPDAPDYDNGVEEFNDFYFPAQDGYQAKITNGGGIDTWQFDGIYNGGKLLFDAGGIGGTDAHKWDMSFATLKGGDYLFGIHDDALYKIGNDGTIETVGDDLKNFRLRELKRISKAKK